MKTIGHKSICDSETLKRKYTHKRGNRRIAAPREKLSSAPKFWVSNKLNKPSQLKTGNGSKIGRVLRSST